jgi:hypothetical protein
MFRPLKDMENQRVSAPLRGNLPFAARLCKAGSAGACLNHI